MASALPLSCDQRWLRGKDLKRTGEGSESRHTYGFMFSSKAGLRLQWRVEKGKFNSLGNTTNPLFQDEKPSQAFLSGFLLQPKLSCAKNSPSGKSLGKEERGDGAGFFPGFVVLV